LVPGLAIHWRGDCGTPPQPASPGRNPSGAPEGVRTSQVMGKCGEISMENLWEMNGLWIIDNTLW